jgi:DNA-binding transcriptional LysR family regulator
MGDLCPRPPVLERLSHFFARRTRTRLHLEYEAVDGPMERLMGGKADVVFHRANPSDPRLELLELCEVNLVPVVAPGFLPSTLMGDIRPSELRHFTQCVIRDTARRPSSDGYFLVDGAHQCSAPDHLMKREVILHRLAWGHLPAWLIQDDLLSGRLISIAGAHLPGRVETLVAARLRENPRGPVAEALWLEFQDDDLEHPEPAGGW